jgi:hypothetical protein
MIISPRQFRVAFFAAAAVSISACSQGSMLSTPAAGKTQSAAHTARGVAVAPQAKAMLALAGQSGNRSVIGKGDSTMLARPELLSSGALYDSIVVNAKGKTSNYIASEGFECCSTKEFGDGVGFSRTGAHLGQVSVILSSWGCQNGFWNTNNCLTTPGSNFKEPITANVYSVTNLPSGAPAPGQLLASETNEFFIPYRPSANNQKCFGSDLGKFYSAVDNKCANGLSVRINFNFKRANVILPQNAIVTVAYNTSDAGYNPYGQNTQCFTGPGGCGYDSLNVSAWGNGGFVGSNIDPNGVFVNFGNPSFYCNQTGNGSGALQLDTPCWTGYHPEIKVSTL